MPWKVLPVHMDPIELRDVNVPDEESSSGGSGQDGYGTVGKSEKTVMSR